MFRCYLHGGQLGVLVIFFLAVRTSALHYTRHRLGVNFLSKSSAWWHDWPAFWRFALSITLWEPRFKTSKPNFRSAVGFEGIKQNGVGTTTTDVIVNVDSTTSPSSGDVQVDVQVRIV